jgi:hypothetical protein
MSFIFYAPPAEIFLYRPNLINVSSTDSKEPLSKPLPASGRGLKTLIFRA